VSGLPLNRVLCGNCLEIMKQFPAESIDMVMFSPPYYGLRDYGELTETIWGGKPDCQHEWTQGPTLRKHGDFMPNCKQATVRGFLTKYRAGCFCVKCGAWKGQLGLEPSWQMYVQHIVEICREIKRVLKKTGNMYIVIGDTYAGSHGSKKDSEYPKKEVYSLPYESRVTRKVNGYKPKCLMGIPWRVAFALIEDGWILRNDVIWHKPNAMPSSVKDRLTQTYEHIFHFVKARRYYYNLDAIREPHKLSTIKRLEFSLKHPNRELGGFKKHLEPKHRANGDPRTHLINKNWARALTKHNLAVNPENSRISFLIGKLNRIAKELRGKSTYHGKCESFQPWNEKLMHNKAVRDALKILEKEEKLNPAEKRFLQNYVHNHAGHPKGKNPGDVVKYARVEPRTLEGWWKVNAPRTTHPKGKNPGDTWKWSEDTKEMAWYHNLGKLRQRMRELGLPEQNPLGRNPGDFWSVSTKPFPEAHFAVYPEDICIRPIKASCPEQVCAKCGLPKESHPSWCPSCKCEKPEYVPGVVLDPMCGSGTTLVVAKKLGRQFIGIDINPAYVEMAKRRLSALPIKLTKFL